MKIFTRTAVLLFGLALATVAAAEATPLASDRDMVTGVSVTEADCRAQSGRLWVELEDRGFCVRFWFSTEGAWLSTAGGSKDEALVAFHGDIGGMIDGKLQLVEQARSTSDEDLQKAADTGSRLYRGPYFFIARPGAFGSSGNHVTIRKTLLEIRVASATLDALEQHYGFKRFHLVGHSGGGHTVAGLVQLRSDIGCAVIASAATSLNSWYRERVGQPLLGKLPLYDPIDHVNAMKQRPDLRLFVVSDRNDKLVSYRSQLEFVERVKAHNLPITHVTATATDKNSHDLFDRGLQLAVDCAHDAPSERAITVKKGESTATILRDLGAPEEDIPALTAALGARGHDGGLREGENLRILFAPDAGRQRVVRVVVVGDRAIEAVVALSDTGKFVSVAPGAFHGVLAPPPAANPGPLSEENDGHIVGIAEWLGREALQKPPASPPVGQPPARSDTVQQTKSPVSGPDAPVDINAKSGGRSVFPPPPPAAIPSVLPADQPATPQQRTASSGARTSVQTYYSLTPDCSQSGTIAVRVLKQPSQGTLEIVPDRGFTNYAADNIRAKCNAQEVEVTRVWYKSNADFKGRDQAELEAFFSSGNSIKTTLLITVK
jgi:pimeloyl-ACP methyl ester carboxylesterase